MVTFCIAKPRTSQFIIVELNPILFALITSHLVTVFGLPGGMASSSISSPHSGRIEGLASFNCVIQVLVQSCHSETRCASLPYP